MTYRSSFHSKGKLLLSGEYFVLDGAKAIGLPCRYGQRLRIDSIDEDVIKWESLSHNQEVWFEAIFQRTDFEIQQNSDLQTAKVLQDIFLQARSLNPDFLSQPGGFAGRTFLEFPRLWGLGSSSTLINNIAQWADVNPFELSRLTLGGSGYDIACASATGPIFYKLQSGKPHIEPIDFDPPFRNQLYFIYLGKKQNSREGIKRYRAATDGRLDRIEKISSISEAIIKTKDLKTFQDLILEHERIVSNAINMPKVQDALFEDFRGVIKSLGAWGGDFVLAASAQERPVIKEYFNKKSYTTFLSYDEMIFRERA